MAPPSEHISGASTNGKHQASRQWLNWQKCLWLLELLKKPAPASDVSIVHGDPGASSVIADGGRDNFMIACAGAMRRWGMTYESILSAIRIDNQARCKPPLIDADLIRIAKSSMRWSQTKGV